MTEKNNTKKYTLPCEILEVIFSQVDHETLLKCHLVCNNWKALIQDRVWRIKAESMVHEKFSDYHNVPWQVFHMICITNRNPFDKNLLKNHSGEDGFEHWMCAPYRWTVENPPVGLPELQVNEDPTFEGRQFCFATHSGIKSQAVNLVDAGFDSYILDAFKPPIEVSEWCCGPKGYKKAHHCMLLTDTGHVIEIFTKTTSKDEENIWIHVIQECNDYKTGLRRIIFLHSAISFSSKIKCKMAGAHVKIKFPYVTANGHPTDNQ